SRIVRAARAATRNVGVRPELIAASTDANVPIALGIPAIALGAGGESGRSHTTDEWFSNERGAEGIQRVLLTLLALAGIAN
ncbi:MAG: M20/M25/M40 family metallo-hydrolase, partial [Longimicrobiales bacterium]